jgi:hypothetical protein
LRVYYSLDLLLSKLSKAQVAEKSVSGTVEVPLFLTNQFAIDADLRCQKITHDILGDWMMSNPGM